MLFSQLKRRNHKLHVHTNDRLSSGLLTQRKKSGGIPPIPSGIPTAILEPPAWDPALNPRWDPANPTRDPCYILGKIPSIPHGIRPLIPAGIPPIPPSNLHLSVWDPANPTWDPKICTSWDPKWDPAIPLGVTCLWPKQDFIYWVFE